MSPLHDAVQESFASTRVASCQNFWAFDSRLSWVVTDASKGRRDDRCHETRVCGVFTALERGGESGSVTGDGVGDFADLYEPLRRFASVVRSLDMDPDDLVQEALVRTLALQPIEELADPAAYLRTVIVRLVSNERRGAGRRRRAFQRLRREQEYESVGYPSDLADLARLASPDRAAVYLAVVERRSHREIAEILGFTEDASRQRVSRALERLRSEISAEADRG